MILEKVSLRNSKCKITTAEADHTEEAITTAERSRQRKLT